MPINSIQIDETFKLTCKEFKSKGAAERAISRLVNKHFANCPNTYEFWVTQISDKCFAVDGKKVDKVAK